VQEIRKMIDRLRGAQIASSTTQDGEWEILMDIISPLQKLHTIKTGRQY
jgi:hypothetical protein